MSNTPILPIVPGGAIVDADSTPADETKDDQNTVDDDVRAASSVNDNLNK